MSGSVVFLGVSVLFLGITAISGFRPPIRQQTSPPNILQATEILPQAINSHLDPIHRVNGVRQCGGQGNFLDWRYTSCDATASGLCQVQAGVLDRREISFIPRRSARSLGVRVTLRDPQSGRLLEDVNTPRVENSAVIGGKAYTLSQGSVKDVSLRGKTLTLQVSVYRSRDQVEEGCYLADFQVV